MRNAIYQKIDSDISNDDFKDAFERIIRRKQETLVASLAGLMRQPLAHNDVEFPLCEG